VLVVVGVVDHEQRVLVPIQQNIQHEVPLLLDSTYEHITEESIPTTIAPTNPSTTDDSTHDANNEGTESLTVPSSSPSPDCPIALRKEARKTNIPTRLKDCVGYKHDIANFVSYEKCSPSFKGFIASLDDTSMPKDWKEAFHDPKWNAAMLEEMEVTWDLVDLPLGKDPMGCKWVYTVKQNPSGDVERYKARLVAKGYT
jgi:hypothetical protein